MSAAKLDQLIKDLSASAHERREQKRIEKEVSDTDAVQLAKRVEDVKVRWDAFAVHLSCFVDDLNQRLADAGADIAIETHQRDPGENVAAMAFQLSVESQGLDRSVVLALLVDDYSMVRSTLETWPENDFLEMTEKLDAIVPTFVVQNVRPQVDMPDFNLDVGLQFMDEIFAKWLHGAEVKN